MKTISEVNFFFFIKLETEAKDNNQKQKARSSNYQMLTLHHVQKMSVKLSEYPSVWQIYGIRDFVRSPKNQGICPGLAFALDWLFRVPSKKMSVSFREKSI